jgi:hypothetical protein
MPAMMMLSAGVGADEEIPLKQRSFGRRCAAIAGAAVILLVGALGGPATTASAQTRYEGMTDPPIVRSLYWFRYVAGRDIRDLCVPGSPLRVRLVYNALFNDHVRTYDIERRPDGSARMMARAYVDIGNVGQIGVSRLGDLAAPWEPKRAERILAPAEFGRLMQALQDSSAFGPPPRGLELPSNDFWWTVASCRDGRWGFQAYHHPTDGFARVRFTDVLYALDGTGVRPSVPRRLEPAEFRGERTRNWRLAVGADGLRDY